MFTIYSESGSDSTMVSNLFIDEYMKSANDAQIKVYLYLLRMMGTRCSASVSDMADQFNHTEKDVVRSLRYWERKGLLNLNFDRGDTLVSIRLCRPGAEDITPGITADSIGKADTSRVLAFSRPAESLRAGCCSMESPFLRIAAGGARPAQASVSADSHHDHHESGSGNIPKTASGVLPETGSESGIPTASSADTANADSGRTGRSSELEALESFRSSTDRARLLFIIEQYIGKPLSLNEVRIIHNISEGLRFSDDMIDYLLQYCVDRGKRDFRYIRKVAENWARAGIMTPAQAEREAARETFSDGTGTLRDTGGDSSGSLPSGAASAAPRRERKKTGSSSGRARTTNSFNQFEQNDYDFDAIEEDLLQH